MKTFRWMIPVALGLLTQSCCHCPEQKPEKTRPNLTGCFQLPDVGDDIDRLLKNLPPIPEGPIGPTNAVGTTMFVFSPQRRLKVELYWTEPLDAKMEDDTFTVTFGQHLLRGADETLTLDGANLARMPLTLTNIDVLVTNFTLVVIGDNAPLASRKLAR